MGRRKVRNYNGREYYKELLNDYFNKHTEEVMQYVVRELGFNSLAEMRAEEMTGMWFDCGFVYISPRNEKQAHEWFLDNDRISSNLYVNNPYYNTQSTTLKELMVRYALTELGLADDFYVSTRLD